MSWTHASTPEPRSAPQSQCQRLQLLPLNRGSCLLGVWMLPALQRDAMGHNGMEWDDAMGCNGMQCYLPFRPNKNQVLKSQGCTRASPWH